MSYEELYPEVEEMSSRPDESTLWIYTLQTFKVAREFHEDRDTFDEHSEDFEEWYFHDFKELMEFCNNKFNTCLQDFRKDWETNFPQM